MKLALAACLLFYLNIPLLHAQQIFKTNGTASSSFFLGNATFAKKTQCLYPASTLTNASSGRIKRLYFRYGTGTNSMQKLTSFKISLGQTLDQSFPGVSFYTNLTNVLDSANFSIPAGVKGDWFSIPVDSIFDYDATKTLVLQLSFETSLVQIWGTLGSDVAAPRKLIASQVNAPTGDASSVTWQDIGFDLATITGSAPQVTSKETFTIFPNPTSGILNVGIEAEDDADSEILIRNQFGKEVLKGKINGLVNQVQIGHLPNGFYHVEIHKNGIRANKTFIKTN